MTASSTIFSYNLKNYKKQFITGICCTILLVILLSFNTDFRHFNIYQYSILRVWNFNNASQITTEDELILNTAGCKIPKTDIMPKYFKTRWHIHRTPKCEYEKQLAIIENEKTLKLTNSKFKSGECCLYEIKRKKPNSDQGFSLSKCQKFHTPNQMDISNMSMFVTKCQDSLDFDAAFPLKKAVRKKLKYWENNNHNKDKQISVLHIGFDSVSRSHAYRSLPKTLEFIKSKMGFIDFVGYHSTSGSTLTNFMAFLMGLRRNEVRNTCSPDWTTPFDNCPLIWKEFNASNYITMYIEDGSQTFNWGGQSGFANEPTDYYVHPLFQAVDTLRKKHSKKYNRKVTVDDYVNCASNETIPQFLARFTKRFCTKFAGQPFYAFTFFANPFHDYIYSLSNFDNDALDLFKHLNSLPELLENTLIVLNSDHGDRTSFFKSNSIVAFIERALPPLFIRIPEKLKVLYPELENIMKENAKKLVSPFDLNHTFRHLLQLSKKNSKLATDDNARIEQEEEFNPVTPSRSSLFLPLGNNRTCLQLSLSIGSCACEVGIGANTEEINYSSIAFEKVVNCVEKKLNAKVQSSKYKNVCSKWSTKVDSILTKYQLGNTKEYSDLLLQFTANPGEAEFEAKVRIYTDRNNVFNSCEILGEFNRVSLYGNQSACIEFITDEDKKMKELCHCKELKPS